MAARRRLVEGRCYTRQQIRERVGGGGLRDFLPHREGRVLAVCLDPGLNRAAPELVDVGPGPERVRWARVAASQEEAIPVFLKREARAWQYVGRFAPGDYRETGRALAAGRRRRANTVGVLRLERASE